MNVSMTVTDCDGGGRARSGFCPEHLYYGAPLERAQEICDAINSFAMEAMGFEQGIAEMRGRIVLLKGLTLRDMLDALACVEAWNSRPVPMGQSKSLCMVPAERLIAAVYTLIHFPPEEEDNLVVRYTTKHCGTEFVNFLFVGRRDRSEINTDGDEDY